MAKKSRSEPKIGDAVTWESSGGPSEGKVIRKVTRPASIKTHKVAASPSQPQFIVESDKSGKIAAHRPGALKKR